MKNAIILHGMPDPGEQEYYNPGAPSSSNAHWLPWLQKQLIVHDIYAQTPEVPDAWRPEYAKFCKEFERYDITPETILVGHSCGGGFIVRWLSEHKVQVGRVVLVAPWLDPERRFTEPGFFDFEIDPKLVGRTAGLTIFASDNDSDDVQTSVRQIREALPGAAYREFHNYGHFCLEDMKTQEFPELLEVLAEGA